MNKLKFLSLLLGLLLVPVGLVSAQTVDNPACPSNPEDQNPNEVCDIDIPSHSLKAILNMNLVGTKPFDFQRFQAVRQNNFDYPITNQDAKRLVHVLVPHGLRQNEDWKIGSLEGLQYFTNLQTLDLAKTSDSRHDLTSEKLAPLAGLTNLTGLNLAFNQIDDLTHLAGLTNLIDLNLHDNQVSDLAPLAGLTSLTDLNLTENQISDISILARLTNLQKLSLIKNKVIDLTALNGLNAIDTFSAEANTGEITVDRQIFQNPIKLADGTIVAITDQDDARSSTDDGGKEGDAKAYIALDKTGEGVLTVAFEKADYILGTAAPNPFSSHLKINYNIVLPTIPAKSLLNFENKDTFTIEGTCKEGATLKLTIDALGTADMGTCQGGRWSFTPDAEQVKLIADGTQEISLKQAGFFPVTGTLLKDLTPVFLADNLRIAKLRGSNLEKNVEDFLKKGLDTNNKNLTFEFTNLPDGVSYDSNTKKLTGKFPKKPGTYKVTVKVSDDAGNTDTKELIIRSLPQNDSSSGGGTVISVSTTGTVMTGTLTTGEVKEEPKPEVKEEKPVEKAEVIHADTEIFNPSIENGKCYTRRDLKGIIDSQKIQTSEEFKKALSFLWSYEMTSFDSVDDYAPYRNLTREEAAKIFSNFAINVLCRKPDLNLRTAYTDTQNANPSLKPYIELAYQLGLMHGNGGGKSKFRPHDFISKAEVNAVLIRMILKSYLNEGGATWYENYNQVATQLGIITQGAGMHTVPRNDVALMLFRAYKQQVFDWRNIDYFSYVLNSRDLFVK